MKESIPWKVVVPKGERPVCRTCGKRLRVLTTCEWPASSLRPISRSFAGFGYDGRGLFHSLSCAAVYGRLVLTDPMLAAATAILVLKEKVPAGAFLVKDNARLDVTAIRALKAYMDRMNPTRMKLDGHAPNRVLQLDRGGVHQADPACDPGSPGDPDDHRSLGPAETEAGED